MESIHSILHYGQCTITMFTIKKNVDKSFISVLQTLTLPFLSLHYINHTFPGIIKKNRFNLQYM